MPDDRRSSRRAATHYNRMLFALELLENLHGLTDGDNIGDNWSAFQQLAQPVAESVAPHLRLIVARVVVEEGDEIAAFLRSGLGDPYSTLR